MQNVAAGGRLCMSVQHFGQVHNRCGCVASATALAEQSMAVDIRHVHVIYLYPGSLHPLHAWLQRAAYASTLCLHIISLCLSPAVCLGRSLLGSRQVYFLRVFSQSSS